MKATAKADAAILEARTAGAAIYIAMPQAQKAGVIAQFINACQDHTSRTLIEIRLKRQLQDLITGKDADTSTVNCFFSYIATTKI
jgi:hypothetical protein